jgi:hypothetical protein
METPEKISALKELCALREAEVLNEEEFNRERKRILRSTLPLRDTLGLLSKLAWPFLALIFFLVLWKPIVSKLSEAEQLAVGSFSVKVRERASREGDPELAAALSGLSQRAIELLMDTGDKRMAIVFQGKTKKDPFFLDLSRRAYGELEGKGLLTGNESWSPFITWALSLPGKSSVLYMTGTGLTITRPNEPYEVAEQYIFEVDQISDSDVRRLLEARFTLNDKGRRIWRLLGKVVSEQLTTP